MTGKNLYSASNCYVPAPPLVRIEEAIGGQSGKDFYAKRSISHKEARETHYWIRLLKDTDYLTKELSKSLPDDVEELLRIIGSIQKTFRNS